MIFSNKRLSAFLLVFSGCLLSIQVLFAQEVDLLIKGGHVIDPKNKIDSKMDVAITAGKISAIAIDIPANTAKKVVDATGLY